MRTCPSLLSTRRPGASSIRPRGSACDSPASSGAFANPSFFSSINGRSRVPSIVTHCLINLFRTMLKKTFLLVLVFCSVPIISIWISPLVWAENAKIPIFVHSFCFFGLYVDPNLNSCPQRWNSQ